MALRRSFLLNGEIPKSFECSPVLSSQAVRDHLLALTCPCLSVFWHQADASLQTSSQYQSLINLSDIANIERTDLKPYCLLLETKDKRIFFSLKSDEELYGWQDDIYSRSPLMGVSNPTNFVHKVHVGFDPISGAFTVRSTHPH